MSRIILIITLGFLFACSSNTINREPQQLTGNYIADDNYIAKLFTAADKEVQIKIDNKDPNTYKRLIEYVRRNPAKFLMDKDGDKVSSEDVVNLIFERLLNGELGAPIFRLLVQTMQQDADENIRFVASRWLAKAAYEGYFTVDKNPTLVKNLTDMIMHDASPRLRSAAIYLFSLEEIKKMGLQKLIIQSMQSDTSAEVREAAVETLYGYGNADRAMLPLFDYAMQHDPSPTVRARALAKFYYTLDVTGVSGAYVSLPNAKKILQILKTDSSPEVRSVALGLVHWTSYPWNSMSAQLCEEVYQVLKNEKAPDVRTQAAKILADRLSTAEGDKTGFFKNPDRVKELIKMLQTGTNPEIVYRVGDILGGAKASGPQFTKSLIEITKLKYAEAGGKVEAAMNALSKMAPRDSSAMEAVAKVMTRAEDRHMRSSAAESLSYMQIQLHPQIVQTFITAYKSKEDKKEIFISCEAASRFKRTINVADAEFNKSLDKKSHACDDWE